MNNTPLKDKIWRNLPDKIRNNIPIRQKKIGDYTVLMGDVAIPIFWDISTNISETLGFLILEQVLPN